MGSRWTYVPSLLTAWDPGALSTCKEHLPTSQVCQVNKNHQHDFLGNKEAFTTRSERGKGRADSLSPSRLFSRDVAHYCHKVSVGSWGSGALCLMNYPPPQGQQPSVHLQHPQGPAPLSTLSFFLTSPGSEPTLYSIQGTGTRKSAGKGRTSTCRLCSGEEGRNPREATSLQSLVMKTPAEGGRSCTQEKVTRAVQCPEGHKFTTASYRDPVPQTAPSKFPSTITMPPTPDAPTLSLREA